MNQNSVTVNQPRPAGFTPQTTQSVFNNNYANAMAAGDPRFNVKQYDRGGMSRGGGQWGQAGIDASQKLASGIAEAYSQKAGDATANANTQLQGQQQQQQYAQQLGALQQQQNNDNAMMALQRQQQQMSFVNSLLGGLLN
jgi:hypothetical protein